ncbi:MAG: FtsX-like permease family protein [Firmicutes bacterium]|nr:FtsX-like permease family protein [Bacillota bacterium]
MKHTQLTDALRNIRKQIVSYLSIILIAFLGVATYLGITFSAAALKQNASRMYNNVNYHDIEIISTMLMTEDDLGFVRKIKGVTDVEPLWYISAKARTGTECTDVYVISIMERINRTELLEGRMPENVGECALEQRLMKQMGWNLGDEIIVENDEGKTPDYLLYQKYTVVGMLQHPDHVSRVTPETYYVVVPRDAFDMEALDGGFMRAEVVIQKDPDEDRFEKAYEGKVSDVMERLDVVAELLAANRTKSIHDKYQIEIDRNQEKLDEGWAELQEARAKLDQGWKDLTAGEKELADNKKKLEDAQAELDDAWNQLTDAEKEIADGEAQLEDGRKKLADAERQLAAGKRQLDEARKKVVNGYNQLEDVEEQIRDKIKIGLSRVFDPGDVFGQIQWAGRRRPDVDTNNLSAASFPLTAGVSVILDPNIMLTVEQVYHNLLYSEDIPEKVLIRAYQILKGIEEWQNPSEEEEEPSGSEEPEYDMEEVRQTLLAAVLEKTEDFVEPYSELANGAAQWDEGHRQYIKGRDTYYAQKRKYDEGLAAFKKAEAEYLSGKEEYENGLSRYWAGLDEYNAGKKLYDEGLAKVADARAELEKGEADYADGLEKYYDGVAQLDEAKEKLAAVDPCRWIVFDGNGVSSFVQVGVASDNLSNLRSTFSLMFILVGALVIYATISKMVDEQRNLVGAMKALGFFNKEIFIKYLIFGVSGTVLGVLLGIAAAYFLLCNLILNGYQLNFLFRTMPPIVELVPTLVVLFAGGMLAVSAIWLACTRLLRSTAISLMQQKVPAGQKKEAKSGKHIFSLFSRLIFRNIRTDLRRVAVTVVSVAGCCALIVIGITLRESVFGSLRHQYNDITTFDQKVRFDSLAHPDAEAEIRQILQESGTESAVLYDQFITYRINNNEAGELLCGDLEAIGGLFRLMDWKTGKPILSADDGILIQRRMAETHDLDVGSEFEIAIGGIKTATVRVAGIYENYIGRAMAMTEAYYRKIYHQDPDHNMFFVRLNGADMETLRPRLMAVSGFENVERADSDRALFDSATNVLNAIVGLLILMAALLAGVVLMNLTNIYFLEKKRELTIMRVNGFTIGKVISYVCRETLVTTLMGIALGIGTGTFISYRIIRTLEQSFLQLERSPSPLAWLIGAGMTIVFTVIINAIVLRKVRTMKLTDVA